MMATPDRKKTKMKRRQPGAHPLRARVVVNRRKPANARPGRRIMEKFSATVPTKVDVSALAISATTHATKKKKEDTVLMR